MPDKPFNPGVLAEKTKEDIKQDIFNALDPLWYLYVEQSSSDDTLFGMDTEIALDDLVEQMADVIFRSFQYESDNWEGPEPGDVDERQEFSDFAHDDDYSPYGQDE